MRILLFFAVLLASTPALAQRKPPAGAKFDYTASDFLDLARQLGA